MGLILKKRIFKEAPDNWDELVEMMDFIKDSSWEFLRFEKGEMEYEEYKASMGRGEFVGKIKNKIGNGNPVFLENIFPYKKLLQNLFGVKHYVLWNQEGRLNNEEIERLIKGEFINKRYCWMERSDEGKSIPEIWHCHVFVEEK